MLRISCFLTAIVAFAALLPSVADADVFHLANGGQVTGQLLNASQEPRTTYEVKTEDGLRLDLPEKQVRRFIPTSDARRAYEVLLPRMPDSAEGNWKMADWCRGQGLDEEREHHLNEAIRLDPEHREARLALGYTSLDGKWVMTDEWNRRRGYVYHQGKWMTPQEVESLSTAQKVADLQRNYRPRLKVLRSIIVRNRDRQGVQDALAEIRGINDPLAGAVLADLYEDEDPDNISPNPQLRLLWVQALASNSSSAAVTALAKAAIEDQSPAVREAARDALEESKDQRAVGALLAELKSKDNARVNRAGAALARIADPETFVPLTEALVTEHKYIFSQGPPGSTSATFSPQGGSGLSAGSKTKVVTRKISNSSVLAALKAVVQQNYESNANFEYDAEAWKSWYAQLHTPDDFSLRRDP